MIGQRDSLNLFWQVQAAFRLWMYRTFQIHLFGLRPLGFGIGLLRLRFRGDG